MKIAVADSPNWLIDHTGIGVSDIHRSVSFYDASLSAFTSTRSPLRNPARRLHAPDLACAHAPLSA